MTWEVIPRYYYFIPYQLYQQVGRAESC